MDDLIKFDGNNKIYKIRGVDVMLDRDVALALGVTTGNLNANAGRAKGWEEIREDGIENEYRFKLTREEGLHCVIPLTNDQLPWVYTELGCAYFGTSLESKEARQLARLLAKAFIKSNERIKKVQITSEDKNRITKDRVALSAAKTAQALVDIYIKAGKSLNASKSVSYAHAVRTVSMKYPDVNFKPLLSDNISEEKSKLLGPGELAELCELKDSGKKLTAQDVNKILEEKGLQYFERIKEKKVWFPSELAKDKKLFELCNVLADSNDGQFRQQMKWFIDKIKEYLPMKK